MVLLLISLSNVFVFTQVLYVQHFDCSTVDCCMHVCRTMPTFMALPFYASASHKWWRYHVSGFSVRTCVCVCMCECECIRPSVQPYISWINGSILMKLVVIETDIIDIRPRPLLQRSRSQNTFFKRAFLIDLLTKWGQKFKVQSHDHTQHGQRRGGTHNSIPLSSI